MPLFLFQYTPSQDLFGLKQLWECERSTIPLTWKADYIHVLCTYLH